MTLPYRTVVACTCFYRLFVTDSYRQHSVLFEVCDVPSLMFFVEIQLLISTRSHQAQVQTMRPLHRMPTCAAGVKAAPNTLTSAGL